MPAIQEDDPFYDQFRKDLAETKNLDHLFTSDRVAKLDEIVGNIEASGTLYTYEEVDAHLKSRRNNWRAK